VRATLPGDPDTIAAKKVTTGSNHRYEWILVGTDLANLRFVVIDRVWSLASP
jgi:hypothetical protein